MGEGEGRKGGADKSKKTTLGSSQNKCKKEKWRERQKMLFHSCTTTPIHLSSSMELLTQEQKILNFYFNNLCCSAASHLLELKVIKKIGIS